MGCLLAYLHRCICGRRDGAALPVSWRDGLDADERSSGSREPEVRWAGGGGRSGRGFTSRGGLAFHLIAAGCSPPAAAGQSRWTRHGTRPARRRGFRRYACTHDLRHSHVSHAVMSGESLHVAGHPLGDRRGGTTNRYVHLDNATLSQVAERVAAEIEQKVRTRQ